MTPELEAELWSKVASWVSRHKGRSVAFTFEQGAYVFAAVADDEVKLSASSSAYVEALRRFVGKLQGNRS